MNNKRICLLTSGHPPFDERIFWKFGKSLTEEGYSVSLFCSTAEINTTVDGISIIGFDGNSYPKNKKINAFYNLVSDINPDLIISSEMLPLFAALKIKKQNNNIKIVLDITEWYPENVAFKYNGLKRWIKYFQLFIPYFYALQKVDHLIIGEKAKKKRYDLIARKKDKTIIGYYPVLRYFNYKAPDFSKEEIVFGYAGVITFERGIVRLLNIAIKIANKYPKKHFKLLLFGRFTYKHEENEFKDRIVSLTNLDIEYAEWTDYDKMSSVIEKMDLCFDLRLRNFIYCNSLPIKIFEYMACGKPFIYSKINPIVEELDYNKFGFLVDPENENEIIGVIEKYLTTPQIAIQQSQNSRKLIEESNNWETESKKLIKLVEKLLD